ncbi:MAG: pentapeptide repeat-containing protein [Sphingobacteriales bacterium]|nr:MAG: pentapeptide repeat-containing protein [Sphingobacteriales bacterium]
MKYPVFKLLLSTLVVVLQIQCSSKSPTGTAVLKSPVSGKDIIRMLSKGEHVLLQNATITGDIDFTTLSSSYRTSVTIEQAEVNGSLTLVNCTVKGKVTGYLYSKEVIKTVVFHKNFSCPGTRFEGEVMLKEAQFQGMTDFTGAIFDKPVSFEGAVWKSRAMFNKTVFYDEARFQLSIFENQATFMDAGFEGICSFQNAVFFTDANFSNTQYLRYADFGNLNIHGNLMFNYAKFSNQAIFSNSHLHGRSDWNNTVFENQADFEQSTFYGTVRWVKSEYKGVLNLENALFISGKPDIQGLIMPDKEKLKLKGAKLAGGVLLQKTDFPH